jgi:hypothetical protein
VSAAVACASPPSDFTKRCGICGRTYAADSWKALRVVSTLSPATVQPHLTIPASWAVELRGCVCGAILATQKRSP